MNSSNNLIGKMLGTCRLEKPIGQGGMGVVYLAQQTRPARYVAVKVLLPSALMNPEIYREFLTRFRREADVIAKLEHVNIIPIYDYGEQDGLAYLVMPYLTGGSLRDRLARFGALSLQETSSYIDQAAAALDYAHAHGVIHRDLKPGNLLLHADGRLVLADFGIARIIHDSSTTINPTLTSTGMFLGTPEYMAPEMARGEPLDQRADIYGLGILINQRRSHSPYQHTRLLSQLRMRAYPPLHQVGQEVNLHQINCCQDIQDIPLRPRISSSQFQFSLPEPHALHRWHVRSCFYS